MFQHKRKVSEATYICLLRKVLTFEVAADEMEDILLFTPDLQVFSSVHYNLAQKY